MAWTRQKSEQSPQRAPRSDAEQTAPPRHPSTPSFHEAVSQQRASIGKSVHIKGDVTAKEDLTIEGTVDGRVIVKNHSLTIGTNSRITNKIQAKSVIVGGEVHGNITAADRVEIAATGSMLGDIAAPRVVLADGARFKGSIDMEPIGAGRVDSQADAATAPSGEVPSSSGLTKTA